jgi:hypothetical protein
MRYLMVPPKSRPSKVGPLIAVLVVVLLGAGAYFAHQRFSRPSVSTSLTSGAVIAASAPKTASVNSPPPTPPAQPATLPAQPVNAANDVIDAQAQASVVPVNEVVSAQPPAPKPAPPAPVAPSPPAASAVEARIPAAPAPAAPLPSPVVVTAPPAPVVPAPQTVRINLAPADAASLDFKNFVANLQINGVFEGDPPRMLIGHRIYEAGDVIDPELGVVFTGIDPTREVVLLKDSSGVTLVKKY